MPIYMFRCFCGQEKEELFRVPRVTRPIYCDKCGRPMERVYDKQNVAFREDIVAGYDVSLGEYIGSRKHLRERLAYHNAHNPDLMTNSNPSAGRLTVEERALAEGQSVPDNETIFEKRKRLGWGNDPIGEEAVATEGVADYSDIRQSIKQYHGW